MLSFPYKDVVRFLMVAIVLVVVLLLVRSSVGVAEIVIISTLIVIIVVVIDVACSASGELPRQAFTQFQVPNCERPDLSMALRMCRTEPQKGAVRGNAAQVEQFLERSNYSAPYATNMPFISYDQTEANKQYAKYDPSLYTNDFQYVTQPPEYYEPLGKPNATMRFDFDHGFTYLNTDKWTVPQRHPPVCISNAKPNVCPITTGRDNYVRVSEFHDRQRTMPHDSINVKYIQDKLNGGRMA